MREGKPKQREAVHEKNGIALWLRQTAKTGKRRSSTWSAVLEVEEEEKFVSQHKRTAEAAIEEVVEWVRAQGGWPKQKRRKE